MWGVGCGTLFPCVCLEVSRLAYFRPCICLVVVCLSVSRHSCLRVSIVCVSAFLFPCVCLRGYRLSVCVSAYLFVCTVSTGLHT